MIPFWLAWIIALTNLFLGLLLPIVYPLPLALVISVVFLIWGIISGFIAPPTLFDLILVPIITISGAFLLLFAGIVTITLIPLSVLIAIGLVADFIAITTGFVPIFGDFFGAVINFLLVFVVIFFLAGLLPAILLSFVAFVVALIPGPFPLTTVSFVTIKLLVGG